MSVRFAALALLAASLAAPAARGRNAPDAEERRMVYAVRHGNAKGLAEALGRHFKGDAEVQSVPGAAVSCLLIRGKPAVLDEVLKTLTQLDRPAKAVFVEVILADLRAKKGKEDKPSPEPDLTGPAEDVVAKLKEMQTKGEVGELRRIQLTTLENQQARARVGEQKPFVMGSTITIGGRARQTSINYQNTGVSAAVIPQVVDDKKIVLQLTVEQTRVHVPEDGVEVGKDDNGKPIRAPEIITATLEAKLSVTSGQAVLARGVKTTSKSERARSMVVVLARVIDPGTGPGK